MTRAFRVFCLSTALVLGGSFSASAAETKACDPIGDFRFLCGMGNPEDLMRVPGTKFLITSGLKRGDVKGGMYLVDTVAKTWKPMPGALPSSAPGPSKYSCPALPSAEQFYAHGLALRPGQGGVHTLYLINHEKLERIEIYSLDSNGAEPKLTWQDCIVFDAPKTRPNSLAPLADGGLAISSFGNPAVKIDEKGGAIYEWHPDKGIVKLAGTEMVGPNGIETSPDGKIIYVNGWGEHKFLRITRGAVPKIEEFVVDFQPDNLHWAPDGTLLSAGSNGSTRWGWCSPSGCEGFVVAKLDPVTMKHRVIMRYIGDAAPLGHASVAYQVDENYWLGTLDGDRIAYIPIAAAEKNSTPSQ